jgi:WhiB family redox-sensing transcriptional regulator
MIDPVTIPERNCNGAQTEIFYPTGTEDSGIGEARRICNGCVALDVCLEFALAIEATTGRTGRHGVFGGKTPRQRAEIARRRASAA